MAWLTGLDTRWALLAVTHLCLAGSFVVLAAYARLRCPELRQSYQVLVLLGFGLVPVTFFFRMLYSESLFFFVALLVLYGLERGWRVELVAVLAGLATAARPVGVALLLPIAVAVWRRAGSVRTALVNLTLLLPLACWGLIGFVVFQWTAFGDPLAFVTAHGNWRQRPPVSAADKFWSLAGLGPVIEVYDPSSPCCWQRTPLRDNVFVNWRAGNPVWWLAAAGLLYVGVWKGWLNLGESGLAFALLLIPYLTRAHEMCMMSMGRFAAVVPPLYLVLGRLLLALPRIGAWAVLAVFAVLLACYAAMFAAWYPFF